MTMFAINKLYLIFFYFLTLDKVKCTDLPHSSLVIHSSGDLEYMDVIVKRVNDSLQLSCEFQGDVINRTYIWNYISADSNVNRPLTIETKEPSVRSFVTKSNLKLSDTGQYICSSLPFSVKKYILVQPRVRSCARGGLTCGERCVLASYLCDGHSDCPEGEDEAATLCGTDQPCQAGDRINCTRDQHPRCVPEAACCMGETKHCQQHPCCDTHPKYSRNEGFVEMEYPALFEDRRAPDDYGFIQSTIYTVTACALIFMIAVVLLVSAICKMHMKRAALRNYAQAERATRHHYNMQYAQAHRFPPCYEASRLLEAANNRSPGNSQQGSPVHASNTQTLHDQGDNASGGVAEEEPSRGFGLSRLGSIFSARYRQVPVQSDVEMTDVRANSLQTSPVRTRLDTTYRSPTFCDLNSGDFYFTSPDAASCGRDLNYMSTPVDFFRGRAARRTNPVERILDSMNNAERPITLQLGRFQLNIPRFGRRRSSTDLGRRPDTPNVAEINIDDLDFVRLNSNDTYTLNGRTIRLLGGNFENYPQIGGIGGTFAPPPYSEVVTPSKIVAFGPPPEYLSRDALNDDCVAGDVNGNREAGAACAETECQANVEMPPRYDELGSNDNNNN